MCDKNIINVLDLSFSGNNDQFNWINNTSNPIQTINDQLKMRGESATSKFTRALGSIDGANNRIQLQINLDVYRPETSNSDTYCATFEVLNGSDVVGVFTLYLTGITSGQRVEYNFDRVYKYEGLSGNISLRITTVEGWQNDLFLDYIKCENFNYCDDDVRNYFVIDGFLEQSIASTSSAFQLLSWKVDGVETLTSAFFSENDSPGGSALEDWFLAKANIDGSNRVNNTTEPNSFNPFISELGLSFDNTNYFDGKPTGTASSSDYGSGILNLGLGKPAILNENLVSKDGAFFIDIDFTKDLEVVFNVLVNKNGEDVFDSPSMFRKYTIRFNASTCTTEYFYNDVLNDDELVDQDFNGFLSGITGTETSLDTIGCDETFEYNGEAGVFEFQLDLGSDTGMTGILYNAYNIPDKFEIEWNGNIYSSGYVGSNSRDQQLLNLGINQSEINTGSPSTGIGNVLFHKDQASPNIAIVRVTAPFEGTQWVVSGICPDGNTPNQPPVVEITSQSNSVDQGVSNDYQITASDSDGTIVSYFVEWGDGGTTSSNSAPPASLPHTYNTLGSKTIKITVVDDGGLIGTDEYIINVVGGVQWTVSGVGNNTCSGAGTGNLEVISGNLPIYNRFVINSGTVTSQDAIFTNTDTSDVITIPGGEFRTLPPGEYTWNIPAISDCNLPNDKGFNQIFFNQTTFP